MTLLFSSAEKYKLLGIMEKYGFLIFMKIENEMVRCHKLNYLFAIENIAN